MEFVLNAVFVAANNCELIEQAKKKVIIKEKVNFSPPTQGKKNCLPFYHTHPEYHTSGHQMVSSLGHQEDIQPFNSILTWSS